MSNAEQVAYQNMLRECENSMFGGDVQDDVETPVHVWINVKDELPLSPKLVWVAVPNVITCRHQVILCYMDSDDKWRDAWYFNVSACHFGNMLTCQCVTYYAKNQRRQL